MTDQEELYVYKRNDGRWEARYIKSYTQDGKPVRSATYGKTREEAIRRRHKLLDKLQKEKADDGPTRLNLLILGAGSHGQNIKEIAESLRVFTKISFLDDVATGDDIIGKCSDALKFRNDYVCAFVAIGDNRKRKKWTSFLKKNRFLIPSIIAPSATISPKAMIGEGVAVLPQSTVNESVIGDFCILASNSLINNGAIVDKYSHIDCGGIVAKGAVVPEATWVKIGKVFSGSKKKQILEKTEDGEQ